MQGLRCRDSAVRDTVNVGLTIRLTKPLGYGANLMQTGIGTSIA